MPGRRDSRPLARRVDAGHIEIPCTAFHSPMGEGTFRRAALGRYTAGPHKGKRCVAKWFKSRFSGYTNRYLREDLRAVDKAKEIVALFRKVNRSRYRIEVSEPEVVSYPGVSCRHGGVEARDMLVEPYLSSWQRWNSNSGWANTESTLARVMQALSHFSYHVTDGRYVLYDLQGGVEGYTITISDPAIGSKSQNYGLTDLGPKGISQFFYRHKCNEFCHHSWAHPHGRREMREMESTVMRG